MIDGGLGKLFREHLPTWDWQRIESAETGEGIPDLNGCKASIEIWIELKASGDYTVPLRPMQVAWAERRIRKGGRVYIACRRQCRAGPRRGAACDELWLWRGEFGRALLTRAMTMRGAANTLGCWAGGPARWDWQAVEELLCKS